MELPPVIIIASKPPVRGIESVDDSAVSIALGFDPTRADQIQGTAWAFPHEIGHIIFDLYLMQQVQLLRPLAELRLDELAFNSMLSKITSAKTMDERRDIVETTSDKVREAYHVSDAYHENHKTEFDLLVKIGQPYHELFADVVAAVFYEDPFVNERMVESFGEHNRLCRSFAKLPSDFSDRESHCALSPIRNDLWNLWVLPRLKNKHDLVFELARIFAQQMQQQAELQRNSLSFDAKIAESSLRAALAI